MTIKVGNDMKAYHNTGTNAAPTWVEMKQIGDVTLDLNVGEAEIDLRESTWLLNLPAKLSASINIALANNPGMTTVFDVLRTNFLARNIKQYATCNGVLATTGTEYLKLFCFISAFPWAQPTQEMSSHDMVLTPAYWEESTVLMEPTWVKTP
jgi:hypothetical protein